MVAAEPWRREQLLVRSAELRARLRADGWTIGDSTSQIIPLVVGEPDRAMLLARRLNERGFWAPGIRPPSVPVGESLIRLSITAGHSAEQLAALADALAEIKRSW